MKKQFKDHFSDKSADYSTYRPHYPANLFAYLASITPGNSLAWDCATGSGQAALSLIEHFDHVIATDASENQIRNATVKSGVTFRTEPAEQTTIDSATVDLITVAQALHWFDLIQFTREVTRVLKPKGVLAIWTYGLFTVSPQIDQLIHQLYQVTLEQFWPPERKLVESGYSDIHFPLQEIVAPSFNMQTDWNLAQLCGYLKTWSAVKKYESEHGVNPVAMIYKTLAEQWGDSMQQYNIQWPLTLRVWIK